MYNKIVMSKIFYLFCYIHENNEKNKSRVGFEYDVFRLFILRDESLVNDCVYVRFFLDNESRNVGS
jgi:hypothetical protein